MKSTYQETRVELIRRIAREALNARALNMMAFAETMVEHYFERTPEASVCTNFRRPHPTDGEQHERDRLHNRQIVDRWVRGLVAEFPNDLEEAWVLALPEAWRHRALRELAARYGLLAAEASNSDTPHALASISDATAGFGGWLTAMAPIVADGDINATDEPHIGSALDCLIDLEGRIASIKDQLLQAHEQFQAQTPLSAC